MSRGGLPDFLVIGAMRAGTTSLDALLRGHPQIDMAREKETDFFIDGKGWTRGLAWYRGQFAGDGRIRGEVSPNYTKAELFDGVPGRAASVVPDARLIFVHRDPVARVASHYAHARLMGRPVPPPDQMAGSAALTHMIEVSCYGAQISAWAAHFPLERFLFLDFAELVERPAEALSRLARFLEVEDRWPTLGTANSEASLALLPDWLFRMRQTWAGQTLRALVSSGLRTRAKEGLAARRTPRAVETELPEGVMDQVRAAVAEDQRVFAELEARGAPEGRRAGL